VLAGQFGVLEDGGSRAPHSMSTCGRREVITSGRHVNTIAHHDDDAASVLGTRARLCASLRPRCARPSGLDGACAQMIDGQLRDGRWGDHFSAIGTFPDGMCKHHVQVCRNQPGRHPTQKDLSGE